MAAPRTDQRAWRDIAVVLAVAAGLRLWHLLELSAWPTFRAPLMDARYHVEWALRLAGGGGESESFFRAPLYPYLLALLHRFTGELVWSPRLLQLGLGLATVSLTHRIASRLLSRPFALFAGLLAAALWLPIHHETELLLEPLFTFWVMLLLERITARRSDPPTAGEFLIWGGIAGLAAITRPNILLCLPAVFWAALRRGEGSSPAGRLPRLERAGARALALVTFGLLLPILPVWLHNLSVGDPRTPIAWQGGINFYLGNNPDATGWSATAPGLRTDWQGGYDDAIQQAEQAAGRPLAGAEVSDYWTRRGLRFWREDPSAALSLTVRKVRLILSPWEIKNNEDPRFAQAQLRSLRWLPTGYGLWLPLALLGVIVLCRRDTRARALAAVAALYAVSVVLFFVCSRYRVPIVYLVPIFAAGSLEWLARTVRAPQVGRAPRLAAALVALVLLHLALRYEPPGLRSGGYFQSYSSLGDAWIALERPVPAIEAYQAALRENPGYIAAWNNLGRAQTAAGRPAAAAASYRRGLDLAPDHPTLLLNLAESLAAQSHYPAADSTFAHLLSLHPSAWDIRWSRARVLVRAGERKAGLSQYLLLLQDQPRTDAPRREAIELADALGDSALARTLREQAGGSSQR
ncbi:MAG: tetratricopeptide repeat protein [Candidatus Eisenbacteria bacterium]|nr:tetratricopeptide repeat protein [Candidatus Eisenbacteria bacterium]MCC7144401.1 tetratricopeptide repeat protein [Candidatus Eisenbacteria bacterium]